MNASNPCPPVETTWVLPLYCCTAADLERVGGKAANLGELLRAGFPVPAGFVVATAVYDRFVAANGLQPAQSAGVGDGAALRAQFVAATLPSDLKQAILVAYNSLGEGAVAVRSSATAEDLPQAAFAGQQDTYLNVIGATALLEAVQRCWASLWTERAIAYRFRQSIDPHTVKLAVVVQRMAPAAAAGVLFTANPVSGRRNELVIAASPGLGEAVVSGRVTPDHFVLRRRRLGWSVVERRLGLREVTVRPSQSGGTEDVAGSATGEAAVPQQVLYRLARLGTAIQHHFGRPQDIEWTWSGREVYIVQARPITALPEPAPQPSRPVRLLAGVFAEMFPIRPYPLDLDTWVPTLSEGAVAPMFRLLGVIPPALDQQLIQEDGVATHFNEQLSIRPTPAILLAPLRLMVLSWRYDPRQAAADPQLLAARRRARELETLDLHDLSVVELLNIVREAQTLLLPLTGEVRRRYLPGALVSAGLLRLLLGLLGRGRLFGALLSGADSATLSANRALAELAGRVRLDPDLAIRFQHTPPAELWAALDAIPAGRLFRVEVQAFLDQYGHREQVLSTSLEPTWKDAPEIVLGLLAGLAQDARPDGLDRGAGQLKAERLAWDRAQSELLAHPWLRWAPLRRGVLDLIERARTFVALREDTHYDATRLLPILRRTLLAAGRRLTAVGVLDDPAEVYHLKLDELERLAAQWPPTPATVQALAAAVRRRRERRHTLQATPLINPQLYQPAALEADVRLHGAPGSPGVAAGPVRVIRSMAEFGRLRPGDVLVAPYTNPAWTPLFQRAVAVVVDSGGAASHAAIVAREYGLPVVMGTVTGTQTLHDGEWVQVDGTRGLVLPAQQRAAVQSKIPTQEAQ